jgi:two-component system, OmpR family, sensor histidine kinase ResE
MIWRSVVGKLWATILLLVSLVLFILTLLLVEYFENFQIEEVDNELTDTAKRIVEITNAHSNTDEALQIASEMMSKDSRMIVLNDDQIVFSSDSILNSGITVEFLKADPDLQKVFTDRATIKKQMQLPADRQTERAVPVIVVGVPLELNGESDEVFIFRSLQAMEDTIESTTKFILLAAGVAFILTTFFAFFLSTRINAPLRKMKEVALEVAMGKFDTKVPILTGDEIGDLAKAFNQMATELKGNISALNEEKEHLASILSSMADGVITFNKDGTINQTNPPADRFLNSWYYEKHENYKKVPSVLMNLFDQSEMYDKGQIEEISLQGHEWVLIVSPLYSSESIRGAVAIIRDMTDERRMDKLRNDFIANVSHELRTPISMLQGYSEAMVDDIASSEEERKEMAKIIYDESLRMGRLVNDLLDLARMQSGKMRLRYESVPLREYLERIVHKFSVLAKEKEIKLSVVLSDDDYYMVWSFDPDRIEQVLTNLIDNAIRHTPEHGTLEVIQRLDQISGFLVIEVKDSGIGIPEEDLAFVFERFYKADKARTRGRSGTGLGLAIAKNIITAHKGFITVNSLKGKGTTFTFILPKKTLELE